MVKPNDDTIKPKKSIAQNKTKRVSYMVAIFTFNFAICWLPTHALMIFRQLKHVQHKDPLFFYLFLFKLFAHLFSYLTPLIDPCLYAFFNDNFRISLVDLFTIRKNNNNTNQLNNYNNNNKRFTRDLQSRNDNQELIALRENEQTKS
jgi:hypothetical protein